MKEIKEDKLQPHNIEAEEAVLGSLLIDPEAIIYVSTFLSPADFFLQRHGWIYEAIQELHEHGKPADLITLSDELTRREQLDEIGGAAYLTSLINATPTSTHIEFYGRIVERTGVLRRLIDASGQIAQMAFADNLEPDEASGNAMEILSKAIARKEGGTTTHISEAITKYYERLEIITQNPGQMLGIPTGLSLLDKVMFGLQRGDMIVMAGRPGMGKTSLALSIALQAARRWSKNIALFSLEMSDEQLVQRVVSAESGIDGQRLRTGDIKSEEWTGFYAAMGELSKTGIYLDDTPAISVLELRSKAIQLHAQHGLDLLIVDYLQLMTGSGKKGEDNRQQEISYISRSIKALARELNIPILALSQLSRQVEGRKDKHPMLSDLRESGSIEQDADIVLFIYRDEVYNPDTEFPSIAEIIMAKHRQGPTGIFSVYFKKHLAQFVDLEVRTMPFEY